MSLTMGTVVVDIGCARYGADYSIERLIEEFQPDVLYGFDPNPALIEGTSVVGASDSEPTRICKVILERKAAWIYDGEVGYREDGLNSWVTDDPKAPSVPCFDLALWLEELHEREQQLAHEQDLSERREFVLKIDAEGSEYDLLETLIARGADRLLKLAWVEWHDSYVPGRREAIDAEIGCELAEWRW